jgi:hypothetical protein
MSIRAEVSSGRIVIDDEGDDLDDQERAALDAHLVAGWKSAQAGYFRPASELLAQLRNKHG